MADINFSVAKLQEKFPTAVLAVETFRGEVTVTVTRGEILEISRFLYSDPDLQYQFLTDLCGMDFFPPKAPLSSGLFLHSMKNNQRLRLKANVGEEESISSVETVWKAANWLEREAFDLYGISFENHFRLEEDPPLGWLRRSPFEKRLSG